MKPKSTSIFHTITDLDINLQSTTHSQFLSSPCSQLRRWDPLVRPMHASIKRWYIGLRVLFPFDTTTIHFSLVWIFLVNHFCSFIMCYPAYMHHVLTYIVLTLISDKGLIDVCLRLWFNFYVDTKCVWNCEFTYLLPSLLRPTCLLRSCWQLRNNDCASLTYTANS